MKSMPFYNTKRLLSSAEGEAGARRLLENLKKGELRKEVRPNYYPRYTGKLEEEDYLSYCKFLGSVNGKRVLGRLEDQDGRDFVEL